VPEVKGRSSAEGATKFFPTPKLNPKKGKNFVERTLDEGTPGGTATVWRGRGPIFAVTLATVAGQTKPAQ